jgi:signal transduction histidine kinase
VLLSLVIGLTLAAICQWIQTRGLEMQVLDFKQRLSLRAPSVNQFVVATLPSRNAVKDDFFLVVRQAVNSKLQEIESGKPRAILLFLDRVYWEATPEQLQLLATDLKAYHSLYLVNDETKLNLALDPEFKAVRQLDLLDRGVDGGVPPFDKKVRRLMLKYFESDSLSQIPAALIDTFDTPVDLTRFKYGFRYLSTDQLLMKYFPTGSFDENLAKSPAERYADKIVFVGFADIFTGSYVRSPIPSENNDFVDPEKLSLTIMFNPEQFANSFHNVANSEYVKSVPRSWCFAYLAFFAVLLVYLCLTTTDSNATLKLVGCLVTFNLIPFAVFLAGDWFMLSVPAAMVSLIVPYFSLPVALYQSQKKRASEKVENERRAERMRTRSHLATKSAEADASFRLAARVAHDIRSPLSALQIIAGTTPIPEAAKALMKRSVDRLEGISTSLLQLHQRSGRFTDRPRLTADLLEIGDHLREHVERIAPEIRFELKVAEDARALDGPAVEFERHLFNLVTNAVEALRSVATPAPHLVVESMLESGFVLVTVTDNGPGIAQEIQARIGTDGATYGKTTGNGLGVSSAKKFFETRQGSLSFATSAAGTKFMLRIPTARPGTPIDVVGALILVDDGEDVLELLGRQATGLSEVFITRNPEAASAKLDELLRAGSKVTIVSDLVFRESSLLGFDVLRTEDGALKNCHRILYTSLASDPAIREVCKTAGITLIDKAVVPQLRF